MKRTSALGLLVLLATTACGSSYAEPNRVPAWSASSYGDPERPAAYGDSGQPIAHTVPWSDPGPAIDSPYRVELLQADSRRLPTYHASGRAYVLGAMGERYRIRIANPTSRRVEAVVSVDGLDAIDGRTANFEDKRGYVIAPYGEITIDGFRTSMDQVATFRFSSVRDSYAGRKGQDRNVGVIGIAFFPERERPVHRIPQPYMSDDRARSSAGAPRPGKGSAAEAESPASRSAAPAPSAEARGEGSGAYRPIPGGPPVEQSRPGLGTEFGERRSSNVGYTTFQRESPLHPQVVVELRYNDRQGLLALGIPVDDVRPDDISLRENATPFPHNRFATPPPR